MPSKLDCFFLGLSSIYRQQAGGDKLPVIWASVRKSGHKWQALQEEVTSDIKRNSSGREFAVAQRSSIELASSWGFALALTDPVRDGWWP